MLKRNLKEFLALIFIIAIFILIRSIHFPYYLNFSHDQGLFSSKALEIFREKSIILLGPPASIGFEDRQLFQGSVIYYFQLIFLILGNFDPLSSSYIFMIFASLMIIPLYFGIKLLINQKTALVAIMIYSLLPYYIDYTRFLWNPNFQFSLSPLLILLMGLFRKTKKPLIVFFLFLSAGLLLQFHYQFIIIMIGIIIYYFFVQRFKLSYLNSSLLGLLVGLSPLIIFEFRNSYYLTKTVFLYIENLNKLLPVNNHNLSNYYHYFLSVSLFFIVAFLYFLRNRFNFLVIFLIFICLLSWSLPIYLQKPTHGFRMAENWNYLDELKTNQIIEANTLPNFNVANLIYDTTASVQKYLLYKNQNIKKLDEYKNNQYLFVLSKKDRFMDDPAYEVNTFKPSSLIKQWPINNYYNLYLLKREPLKII